MKEIEIGVIAFGTKTALWDLITVAPPVGLLVGGVALRSAGFLGIKRIFDGTFTEVQKSEILRNLKELLKDIEAKERALNLSGYDRTKLYILLKEPVRLNLITPEKAQKLIKAVESGKMPIKEAIKTV